MHFSVRHYVPCLRWKQGEYQAIFSLSTSTKSFITPLIEIPEIGYDFEAQEEAKSIDQHLAKFGKRLESKWRFGQAFIDLKLVESYHRMEDGRHPVTYVFEEIGARNCPAVPVTGVNRDEVYQRAVAAIVRQNGNQLCVRMGLEEAAQQNAGVRINDLLSFHGTSADKCDFVFDLGAPNFIPINGILALVQSLIERTPHLLEWQTFTLLGTAFPASMGEIEEGAQKRARHEWLLYKALAENLRAQGSRIPTFGDYSVNHPDVLTGDMRLLKPAATIRYTIDDAWLIIKGKNVRKHGLKQYRSLCKTLVDSDEYLGAPFSMADAYIAGCARGHESTGNLTTWRRMGTNHHIEKVVRDVASFCDSLGLQ